MKITPFNEVNEAVQKAVDWLSNIGIDVTRTRMGEYSPYSGKIFAKCPFLAGLGLATKSGSRRK